jgi:hypothetical protein
LNFKSIFVFFAKSRAYTVKMGQIAAVAMDLVDFSRISAKKLKKNGILCFFG